MVAKKAPARPGRRRPPLTGWADVQHSDWRESALCEGRDTEVFFPEGNQPTIIAKSICRRCPVRPDCLAHALAHRERHGIWGGFTEHARALLVARIARSSPEAAAERSGDGDGPVAA